MEEEGQTTGPWGKGENAVLFFNKDQHVFNFERFLTTLALCAPNSALYGVIPATVTVLSVLKNETKIKNLKTSLKVLWPAAFETCLIVLKSSEM